LSIEAELERRATADKDAEDFWHRYKVMKKYLADEYYPWIQSNSPYFTDHGSRHIESVIQAAESVLSKHLVPENGELSSLDLFLLLSGIIWHDVGMVYQRSGHAQKVAEMTKEIRQVFPNIQIQRLVEEISSAHSGESGLNIPRADEDCTTENRRYKVYARALAAIVRFADEISENHSRISKALTDKVPKESRVYWEYANCIWASYAEPARERVVVDVEIQCDKVLTKLLCKDFSDRTGGATEMPLVKYTLYRLEKMNNERVYCSRFFSRYAYFKSLEVRFTLLKGTARVPDYDELTVMFEDFGLSSGDYPNIKVVESFFAANPAWTADRIEEALR
jgi:HD superfamily phosphodiesterase